MAQYNADARGRQQGQHQQNRFETQHGPMTSAMAYNYGRGSEMDYGDRANIMNKYNEVYGGAGGGGGGGGISGFAPSMIGYKDPFNSYSGFEEFSKTGGYSPQDTANMRARGISPIRATYANAQRELGRGRALQGGYSPNMAAAQVKMAREQGQSAADATQNVEAGLAEARNRGRLSGLTGMSDIEKQRLAADLEVGKFNASAQMSAGASGSSAQAQNAENQLAALRGMTSLYGTTPGQSELFGNQLGNAVGQGGNFGINLMNAQNQNAQLPGQWDTVMGRVGDVVDTASQAGGAVYPWLSEDGGGGYQQQTPNALQSRQRRQY